MASKVSNNAWGVLTAGITATATTITLASGQGARFPVLGGSDWCWATLSNAVNTVEIVKVTAIGGDVFTVLRGQDGSLSSAFLAGDRLDMRPTAALFNDKQDVSTVATATVSGVLSSADWSTFNGKQAALGFTPYNATNPSGYISSITSSNVTTALGFTPYNATNPSGYISGITSGNVTTALGYVPLASATGSFAASGLVEVGRYFDFHGTTNANDYDVRFDCGVTGSNGGGAMIITCGSLTLNGTGAFSAPTISGGTVTQTSDERKKTNWRQLTDEQLDSLSNMEKSGLFDWVNGDGESCGGSAQEIRAIVPQAVHEDEEGNLTVNYGGLCFAIQQATLRRLWGNK